jgi:hypothetical protein
MKCDGDHANPTVDHAAVSAMARGLARQLNEPVSLDNCDEFPEGTFRRGTLRETQWLQCDGHPDPKWRI